MKLDLSTGVTVKIADPGAPNFGAEGTVKGKRGGQYLIAFKENDEIANRLFGVWWIDSALKGTVPQLPIVNVMPTVERNAVSK